MSTFQPVDKDALVAVVDACCGAAACCESNGVCNCNGECLACTTNASGIELFASRWWSDRGKGTIQAGSDISIPCNGAQSRKTQNGASSIYKSASFYILVLQKPCGSGRLEVQRTGRRSCLRGLTAPPWPILGARRPELDEGVAVERGVLSRPRTATITSFEGLSVPDGWDVPSVLLSLRLLPCPW